MKALVAALTLLAATVQAAPLSPGTVFKTEKGGALLIVDRNGRTEEYLMRSGTKVFRDVTKVGNDLGTLMGPEFTAMGCCTATKYYDRASGWGSVNFPSFSYQARKLGGQAPSGVTGRYGR